MSTLFTLLLFGAAIFLAIATISIIRGVKLKERAYCINGSACVLLSLWMVLMYFSQFVLGMGFFIAGAIIGLANYSKSMKHRLGEAVTQQKETDVSKPLKISLPLVLLILNEGNLFSIAFIAILVTVGVVISSVPIFNQQIVKNLEVKKELKN